MRYLAIETRTPRKPEINLIMKECKCSRAVAFLAFFDLYSYFSEHCVAMNNMDGIVRRFTADDVDEFANLPNAGKAFEMCGWLSYSDGDCIVLNWVKLNEKSSLERLDAAYRQRRHRAKCSSQDSVTTVTDE